MAHSANLTFKTHHKGNAPFNEILGYAPGNVPAYSNGKFGSFEPSYLHGVFMGHKWQCVEFARRWLFMTKGLIFGDIPMAHDMFFDLKSVERLADNQKIPLIAHENGSKTGPMADSFLIYKANEENWVGHVAVITEVGPNYVRVADQNFDFQKWTSSYAREIPLVQKDGGFWITENDPKDEILGWLEIQSDGYQFPGLDALKSQGVLTKFQAPFKPGLMRRLTVNSNTEAEQPAWLSPEIPHEAAFMKLWGIDVRRKGDQPPAFYGLSLTLVQRISMATNELQGMFLTATEKVIGDDALMTKTGIEKVFWPAIRQSWADHRNHTVMGRMDFAFDGTNLKLFEYNADSAATLLECGSIQRKWSDAMGIGEKGWSLGFRIEKRVKQVWKQLGAKTVVHVLIDQNEEEVYTAMYMQFIAHQAKVVTKLCVGMAEFTWLDNQIVDAENVPVKIVWKLWNWNTIFDDYLAAEKERVGLEEADWRKNGAKVRLSDVMMCPSITVIEPMWKSIMNNKALLAILWEMYPDQPNLLKSTMTLTDDLRKTGFAAKPVTGRCGANVTLTTSNGDVLADSVIRDPENRIYQELFRIPSFDGYYPVLGSWVIGGNFSGLGLREDNSHITNGESPFAACRMYWKEEDLAQM